MVKAGYNPLYMESIYQKTMSDGTRLNFVRTHPKGSIRVANIHQKIVAEYPEFLEQKIEEKVQKNINQEDTLFVKNKSGKTTP